MLTNVSWFVSAPPSVTSVVGQVDLAGSLNLGLAGVIFSFMQEPEHAQQHAVGSQVADADQRVLVRHDNAGVLQAHHADKQPDTAIVVTTLLGWMLGDVHYTGIVSAPPSVTSVVGQVDLAQ
jgi:hypothetical protein